MLTAIGAYQLGEVLTRLARGSRSATSPHRVVYVLEPGRFRAPRSAREAAHAAPLRARSRALCARRSAPARVFLVAHAARADARRARAAPHRPARRAALGYLGAGGTLDVDGLLYVNRSSWAHVLRALARVRRRSTRRPISTPRERAALDGRRNPTGVIVPPSRRSSPGIARARPAEQNGSMRRRDAP